MPDMGSIAAAIGGLKTAAEITKSFLDLKEAAAVQGKVIELQGVILAAQSSALAAQSDQMTLLEDIRALKEKMAKLEAWEAEKQRYKLTQFTPGVFAYALKPEEANGEPPHQLCAACFDKGQKSVLQHLGDGLFKCHVCDSRVRLRPPERGQQFARSDYDPFTGR